MEMKIELDNAQVNATYYPDRKEISVADKVDQNNCPAEYNTSRRGLAKAWKKVAESFNGETTMRDIGKILRESGISMHYYCRMD